MTSRLPYIFNIIVLLPVATFTLFGGASGVRRVFQGRFPDSAGIRTIVGSVWMALLIASILGLYSPNALAPILLVQVLYKLQWLFVFALPRLATRRANEVPPGIAVTFLAIVLTYPWAVNWAQLFSRG